MHDGFIEYECSFSNSFGLDKRLYVRCNSCAQTNKVIACIKDVLNDE